jgi:hypothetical protein
MEDQGRDRDTLHIRTCHAGHAEWTVVWEKTAGILINLSAAHRPDFRESLVDAWLDWTVANTTDPDLRSVVLAQRDAPLLSESHKGL